MGLFSFKQELAIDLGTANTIIISKGKIVVDQPSVVALDRRTNNVVAIGEQARQMHGKTHDEIKTIRPLKDGVIANFTAAEKMIRGMIEMFNKKRRLFPPQLRIVICIPSGSTEVERRAIKDSAERAGGREVYMIYEPMAAALGIGIDVEAPEGNMIVDIGGGTTEIAVISLGGIVSNKSIKIAGDDLTEDIMEYMGRTHNIRIGENSAEKLKFAVGAALPVLSDEEAPEDFFVRGPNRITSLPMDIPVSYSEIAECLDKSLAKIDSSILSALENTPAELYSDIVRNGIYITGGGANLRGLSKRFEDKIGIKFHIADDPLLTVAKGTGIALKNIDKFNFLMKGIE